MKRTSSPGEKEVAQLTAGQPKHDSVMSMQLVGWAAMLGVLVLGALGLFGDGPLATRRTASPDGKFRVTYDGYQRSGASTLFEVTIEDAGLGRTARICPDRRFLDVWRLRHTEPGFLRAVEVDDGLCWEFAYEGRNDRVRMQIYVQPRDAAVSSEGALRADGERSVSVRAMVWP